MNEMILMNRWYMLPCVSHCPSHFKMLLHWVQRLNLVRIVYVCVCVCVCEEEEKQEDSEQHIETFASWKSIWYLLSFKLLALYHKAVKLVINPCSTRWIFTFPCAADYEGTLASYTLLVCSAWICMLVFHLCTSRAPKCSSASSSCFSLCLSAPCLPPGHALKLSIVSPSIFATWPKWPYLLDLVSAVIPTCCLLLLSIQHHFVSLDQKFLAVFPFSM